jgi:hypothetical protein
VIARLHSGWLRSSLGDPAEKEQPMSLRELWRAYKRSGAVWHGRKFRALIKRGLIEKQPRERRRGRSRIIISQPLLVTR